MLLEKFILTLVVKFSSYDTFRKVGENTEVATYFQVKLLTTILTEQICEFFGIQMINILQIIFSNTN